MKILNRFRILYLTHIDMQNIQKIIIKKALPIYGTIKDHEWTLLLVSLLYLNKINNNVYQI